MERDLFRDRRQAGVQLAEVAKALNARLDVFVVRKLGVPGHRELTMGAIAAGGVRVLNDGVVTSLRVPRSAIEETAREEGVELERRERAYRSGRASAELKNHVVLLVDDGLATGSTMKAAVQAVRVHGPGHVVVAVPVGAPQSCALLRETADEVICAREPEEFAAVGQWYVDFEQTGDAENAVWSYLRPNAEYQCIKGYYCFYPEKMDLIEVEGERPIRGGGAGLQAQ